MEKRKTKTSNEVKKRYNDKTYYSLGINLRYDSDQDAIKAIEALKSQGLGTTAAVLQLIRKGLKK